MNSIPVFFDSFNRLSYYDESVFDNCVPSYKESKYDPSVQSCADAMARAGCNLGDNLIGRLEKELGKIRNKYHEDIDFMIPSNLGTVPLKTDPPPARVLSQVTRPEPQRTDPPLFEDINHMVNLITRDRVLTDIDVMSKICEEKGDPFFITPTDFTCDYFYPGFMSAPSRSGHYSHNAETLISAINNKLARDKPEKMISIWCEGAKALGRYARAGVKKLVVVYPSGYPNGRHDDLAAEVMEKYDIDIVRYDFTEEELENMSSEDLAKATYTDSSYYFSSVYLPQYGYLKDHFYDYLITGFDYDYSDESVVSLPPVDGTYAQRSQFYFNWITDNYKHKLHNNTSFGFYDLSKSIRVSYSEHGVWLDTLINPAKMGEQDYSIQPIQAKDGSYNPNGMKLLVKVASTDFDVEIIDNPRSVDLSVLGSVPGSIYFPCTTITEVKSSHRGTLYLNGEEHRGFKPGLVYKTMMLSGVYYIVDVGYNRKFYYDRISKIPEKFLFKGSIYPEWKTNYILLLDSYDQVDHYCISRDAMIASLRSSRISIDIDVHEIDGVGWNPDISALVYDPSCSLSLGPFLSVLPKSSRTKDFFEFLDEYRLRRGIVIGDGEIKCLVQGSKLIDKLDSTDVTNLACVIKDLGDDYFSVCEQFLDNNFYSGWII